MRHILTLATLSFMAAVAVQAQDTYLNDRALNTSDIIGTSRYVGMGGAMGALGADISVMSNNPAGTALMRRADISFTLGGQIQAEEPQNGESRGTFTFDQIGFVISTGNDTRVNFGFNYHKKVNFNQNIYAHSVLNGLSQGDMFGWMANQIVNADNNNFSNPMYMDLYKAQIFKEFSRDLAEGKKEYYFGNDYRSTDGYYMRGQSGSLQGYDFNVSVGDGENERFYFGLTMGVDYLIYRADATYEESGAGAYRLYQSQKLKGYGFNIKGGFIGRPIEDNPFRVGLAIETPSWYTLRHTSYYGISIPNGTSFPAPYVSNDDNYLKYNVYTPWKFRVSMGSTYENLIAWDVEYEYSLNNWTKMGYPKEYDDPYDRHPVDMDKDKEMNRLTKRTTNGIHNVRVGLEVKPVKEIALRGGYNFYSAPHKKNARLDQTVNSLAMDYATSTDYMNLGITNIFTLGIGYRGPHFYIDAVYKYRAQKGDFFAFDDQFTSKDENFMRDYPQLKGQTLSATEVNLDRHNIAVTLGYKF